MKSLFQKRRFLADGRFLVAILVSCIAGTALSNAVAVTLMVENNEETGSGSLRQAVADSASGDRIEFAASVRGTITLHSSIGVVGKSISVVGPGAALLTITQAGHDRILGVSSTAALSVSGLTFANGRAPQGNHNTEPGWGGAISNAGYFDATGCTFENNHAGASPFGTGGGLGGAIFNTGNLLIASCTFRGNNAGGSGGAIYNSDISPGGAALVKNSTFAHNTAFAPPNSLPDIPFEGGALSNRGNITLESCTIAENISDKKGGGIFNSVVNGSPAFFSVANCIIARNSAVDGKDGNGAFVSQGFNLFGNGDGALIGATTGDQIGSSASPIDPLLGPLGDNGGPTPTCMLLRGSPAIDRGNSGGLAFDQRGGPRPVDHRSVANASGGDGADIGAVEVPLTKFENLSTRVGVMPGDNAAIGGFITSGAQPKNVLIRGIGPSLQVFGVPGTLTDPMVVLHDGDGVIIASNDDWRENEAAVEATGIAPTDDRESAILATLAGNNSRYTAILQGKHGASGIGLIEVYDLDTATVSDLANISTRGFVDLGDKAVIGGFIVGNGGTGAAEVVVRALGPSLDSAGVPGVLQDTTLELYDSSGVVIATNDNWKDTQEPELNATGIPPTNDFESAIVQTLAPGSYTAVVRGKNGTSGVGLVEVYNLQ